jgi:predicted GH43/DUF377 family glycosyl hydrolase
MFTVTRSKHNPILSPDLDHSWEAAAAFNASPVIHDNQTYLIYRAMSDNEILKVDGKVVLDDKNRPTFKGTHAVTYRAMIDGGNFILIEEMDDTAPLHVEETTIKTRKKRVKKNESDQGTGTDSGDSGDSEGGDTDGGTDTED